MSNRNKINTNRACCLGPVYFCQKGTSRISGVSQIIWQDFLPTEKTIYTNRACYLGPVYFCQKRTAWIGGVSQISRQDFANCKKSTQKRGCCLSQVLIRNADTSRRVNTSATRNSASPYPPFGLSGFQPKLYKAPAFSSLRRQSSLPALCV